MVLTRSSVSNLEKKIIEVSYKLQEFTDEDRREILLDLGLSHFEKYYNYDLKKALAAANRNVFGGPLPPLDILNP